MRYKRTYYYALVHFEAEGKTIEQEISYTASIEREIKEEMCLVYLPGEPEKALFEVFLENSGSTTSTIVVATLIVTLSLWMMFLGK